MRLEIGHSCSRLGRVAAEGRAVVLVGTIVPSAGGIGGRFVGTRTPATAGDESLF
jgi:hypothetical protein